MTRKSRTRSGETDPHPRDGGPDGRWASRRDGPGAVLFLLSCAFLLTVWAAVTGQETTVSVSRSAQTEGIVTAGTTVGPSADDALPDDALAAEDASSVDDVPSVGGPSEAGAPGDGPVSESPSPGAPDASNDPGTDVPVAGDPAADAPDAPGGDAPAVDGTPVSEAAGYVLNTSSKKFHLPSCPSAAKISEKNREVYAGDREELLAMGYDPCKRCMPPESGT